MDKWSKFGRVSLVVMVSLVFSVFLVGCGGNDRVVNFNTGIVDNAVDSAVDNDVVVEEPGVEAFVLSDEQVRMVVEDYLVNEYGNSFFAELGLVSTVDVGYEVAAEDFMLGESFVITVDVVSERDFIIVDDNYLGEKSSIEKAAVLEVFEGSAE